MFSRHCEVSEKLFSHARDSEASVAFPSQTRTRSEFDQTFLKFGGEE
jgi:hypothetical protein